MKPEEASDELVEAVGRTTLARLKRLEAAADKAADKFHRELALTMQVGKPVRWEYNGYPQTGHVVMTGCGNRVKVENERTGKEVWITFYQLLPY